MLDIFGKDNPNNKRDSTNIDGGINQSFDENESEVDLNEEEEAILKEFEKNDNELEEIAGKICGELDKLKVTT